jgi:hypothetical protein
MRYPVCSSTDGLKKADFIKIAKGLNRNFIHLGEITYFKHEPSPLFPGESIAQRKLCTLDRKPKAPSQFGGFLNILSLFL